MDECNKKLLKTVETKLDEFIASGTCGDGVKEEEVQDLIDFAEDLYDPFEGETISPIPQVNELCRVCRVLKKHSVGIPKKMLWENNCYFLV